MVSSSQSIAGLAPNRITGRNGLIDRYFYLAMSLLAATIVVWGFSHTINNSLFHPAIPRPFLLWIHGAAFSAWVVFYISQSVLIRTHNVKVHRTLGWFGVALAATMVVLGFAIAVIMGSFDKHMLHIPDADTFLSVPFSDMLVFGTLVTLAILWRKKPELHRRLLFIATFALMDAPFGRIDYIFNNNLFFVCVDSLILLGVARDLLVNRRIHRVYLVALPVIIALQALAVYLWRGAPAWWQHLGQSILG
jgi:FtsH-binding integral membrane protein